MKKKRIEEEENQKNHSTISMGKNRRHLEFFFFQAEDGIRDYKVTGVQTCALPIWGCPRAADPRRPAPPVGCGWWRERHPSRGRAPLGTAGRPPGAACETDRRGQRLESGRGAWGGRG